MKAIKACNKTTQILAVLASVAALIMFFLAFATVTSNGQSITLTGAQMCFHGKVELASGEVVKMAISADVLFCFLLTAVGVVFSALTFKSKGMRYASPFVTLAAGIYMLVVSCSKPVYFVDVRPLPDVTSISYQFAVWGVTVALLAAAVFGIAHLLLDDHILVAESKGGKLTIPKRVVRFFKDYKSEVKKIVWPSRKSVFKNTLIVLVMCLIIGAFIWLLDFGLAKLLDFLFAL